MTKATFYNVPGKKDLFGVTQQTSGILMQQMEEDNTDDYLMDHQKHVFIRII